MTMRSDKRDGAGSAKPSVSDSAPPHESAHLHVAGEATYVDDVPAVAGMAFAALGLSEKSHAVIVSIDLSAVRAMPGVIDVITADDIPAVNNCGPIEHDDPILADGLVQFLGQPVFAVYARSYTEARKAARMANIEYEELPAVLSPREAHDQQSYVVPPMHLRRGDVDSALESSSFTLDGMLDVGGQEQFYLEGQISTAIPREDGGFFIQCSTQHPSEMQKLVCDCLGLQSNQVVVEVRRMGGGFGGKESQSALFCCVAALGAHRMGRPVKLRLDRDDDMLITGKRHCFHYRYKAGYESNGLINAVRVEMITRSGFSADLSAPVATRAVCHVDNTYYLSNVDISAYCAKTNTQSNTAFRGFGGPQGAIVTEYLIDDIARNLGVDALAVRRANFYADHDRNTTPYGQVVEDNVIHQLVDDLVSSSDYIQRKNSVVQFNAQSPVLKKGIALTPVKFGISFNVKHFNQAGALVHVYIDGSVLVNHGGTEMGQGLNTKVSQVVASVLGISFAKVRATATDTSKVANTSATAASTGADLNGKAAEDAAMQIRQRLALFFAAAYGGSSDDVDFSDNRVANGSVSKSFSDVVAEAYVERVQLWSDGFYATPELSWNKDTLTGSPFYYFAYGAAVSEVVIDTLTGEWSLLEADLLHDAGASINPAIDIGQVEGAFIQGMGWLTLEQLHWNDAGFLTTHAPSTYKIPAVNDCPPKFKTRLFHNPNRKETVMRSKAVGEPPLLLGFSVFFALRDAVASVADYQFNPPLQAPATPEHILDAIDAVQQFQLKSLSTPVTGCPS